jgi:hypothetical protein
MPDEKKPVKVVEGEVVDEDFGTVTGRLRVPDSHIGERDSGEPERWTEEQRRAHHLLMQHIDTSAIERTIFNTYAGQFIGLCYDPDGETETPLTQLVAELTVEKKDKP